ncbi:hypothetical protein C7S13_8166 [Burkholderia cepacia]|nr:hypothetical protein [Burkholderia cepacia]
MPGRHAACVPLRIDRIDRIDRINRIDRSGPPRAGRKDFPS